MGILKIAVGFNESERERVGSLYWEAFGRKLRPAFASNDEGLRVAGAALRPDRMLVARADGLVVGVCGFYESGNGAADLSWSRLTKVLTFWKALRAGLVLSVLARSDASRVLVLDGICVDALHRGAGIGTALLDEAERYARDHALSAVRLSVVDRNPRAEALYRRRGFSPVDSGSLGILGYVYGFDRYKVMDRVLPA